MSTRTMGDKILVRVPRTLKANLQKEARAKKRSLSDYIRLILAKRPEQGRDVQ